MAEQLTTNDLLLEVLYDLDDIIKNQKKAMKPKKTNKDAAADSAIAGVLGGLKPDDAKALTVSLGTLQAIILNFKSIKKTDVDNMVGVITSLNKSLKSFQLSKKESEGVNNMLATMAALNNSFGALAENFFSTMLKFNPIKGFLLGRRIGKFYKNLLEGFEKSKLSDLLKTFGKNLGNKNLANNITAFSSVLAQLFAVDLKKLQKLGKVLKKFPAEGGQNFAGFLRPIIGIIKELPEDLKVDKDTKADSRLNGFISLIKALCSIKLSDLVVLWGLSKFNEKHGENIGSFFNGLIKSINKNDKDDVKNATNLIKGITGLILGLTVAVIALVILAATTKITDILLGITMLGTVLLMAVGLIKLLSSDKMKKGVDQSWQTLLGITALILGVALTVVILTALVRKNKFTDILGGIAVMAMVLLACVGVIHLLSSNKFQKLTKEAILGMAGVIAILFGVALVSLMFISVGKHGKEIGIGATISVAVLFAGVMILQIASKIDKASIIKGLLGLAGIVATILLLSVAMNSFVKMAKEMKELKFKDIAFATGISLGMIALIGAVAFGAGALVAGPQGLLFVAGVAALNAIGLTILTLSKAMTSFADFIILVNTISKSDIKHALEVITGKDGMVDGLLKIIKGLDDVGIFASMKIKRIAKALNPLFDALSKYVDIIGKIANMKMVEGYDANGNPIYKAFDKAIFMDAADVLATGFATFLTKLNGVFGDNSKSIKMTKKILKALNKGGIRKLMKALSNFVDVIQKMANLKIPTEWNSEGQATAFKKMTTADFKEAASIISEGFTAFLVGLNNAFDGTRAIKRIKKILKALKKGDVGKLMKGVSGFVDAIVKLASAGIPLYDENGKEIGKQPLNNEVFTASATVLANGFAAFLSKLEEEFGGSGRQSKRLKKLIKRLSKAGIDKLMGSISSFIEPVMQIASGYLEVNGKSIEITEDKLVKGGQTIAKIFESILTPLNDLGKDIKKKNISRVTDATEGIIDNANKILKLSIEDGKMTKNAAEIKSSLNTVFSIINDTEKISVRNANDFADKIEYISDAISSIKFHKLKTDNMTDKINTLKDSLNTILEIINTYNNVDVKHTRQFANKLSHVSDAINGIELIPGKIDIASLVNNRDNLIVLYDVIKDSNQISVKDVRQFRKKFDNLSEALSNVTLNTSKINLTNINVVRENIKEAYGIVQDSSAVSIIDVSSFYAKLKILDTIFKNITLNSGTLNGSKFKIDNADAISEAFGIVKDSSTVSVVDVSSFYAKLKILEKTFKSISLDGSKFKLDNADVISSALIKLFNTVMYAKIVSVKDVSRFYSKLNILDNIFKRMSLDGSKFKLDNVDAISSALTKIFDTIIYANTNKLGVADAMKFKFMIDDIVDGMNKLVDVETPNNFIKSYKETTKGIKVMYDSMQLYADVTVKQTEQYKDKIKNVADSLAYINKPLSKFPIRAAEAFKELDNEIITKDEARVQALRHMADEFKGVTDAIKDLNIELAKSNEQIRKFNLLSTARQTSILGKVGEGITKLKEKVVDHIQVVKDNTTATKEAQTNNPNQTAQLVAAITQGLTEWAENERIFNIKIADKKAITAIVTA